LMSLDDYNANTVLQTRVVNEVARAAGVSTADVTVEATQLAGGVGRMRSLQTSSVRLTATIAAASPTVADFISGRLADATASDIGSALGVTVIAVSAPVRGYSFLAASPGSGAGAGARPPSATSTPDSSDDDSSMPQGAMIGIVIAGIVAAIFIICTCCLISAERAGKPIFSSLPQTTVVAKRSEVTLSDTHSSAADAAEKL